MAAERYVRADVPGSPSGHLDSDKHRGGAARHGRREFARFLNISLGSLAELNYLLLFSRNRGLCDEAEWRALESLLDQTGKLVYGLYRRVRPAGPTSAR